MSSTPTSTFVISNSNSDDDTCQHHQYQQRESSPSTSSSLSTKLNSLLSVHDIVQMTPHESEVETMIFNDIQQQEAAEKKKYRGQPPSSHYAKHSLFQCIPDDSLRYYIGKNTDRHNTTASTSDIHKPDTIERRARSDTHQRTTTTSTNETPLRSNRTPTATTTSKPLYPNDTRKKYLPPLARSSTMNSNNSYNHRFATTKAPSQRRHRRSNSILTASSTGTTLATMAQQLDEFQNANSHPIREPFHTTSPSSSSLQSRISRQNEHPDTECDVVPVLPSAVNLMIVPPKISKGQRPISPLASKDYNVQTSSGWSLDDSDDDSNDQDSLLLNPKSPPHDTTSLDDHDSGNDTKSEAHFLSSNNTVITTSTILTTKAVSDWIKKRRPTNITVTTVEQDSDGDNINDDDDDSRSLVPATIKLSSDDDDVEWGKTIRNLLSPTSLPVSPHTNANTSEHLVQESRIIKIKECCRCWQYSILQFRTPTSFHDLWYDFEIFVPGGKGNIASSNPSGSLTSPTDRFSPILSFL